jgi:hypothetical protein
MHYQKKAFGAKAGFERDIQYPAQLLPEAHCMLAAGIAGTTPASAIILPSHMTGEQKQRSLVHNRAKT